MSQFIRAIEIDQTPNQMLMRAAEMNQQSMNQIAETMRRQMELDRKLKADDEIRRSELFDLVSPSVLEKNFDKDVVKAEMSGLVADTAKIIKDKSLSLTDAREAIAKRVSGLSDWSNRVSTIKANAEKTISGLKDNKGVDINGLYAAAVTRALRNPDGSLKRSEEIDPTKDYVAEMYAEDPTKFVDMTVAGKEWQTIKDKTGKVVREKSLPVTVGGKTIQDSFKFEVKPWQDVDKSGVVTTIKDQDGYLDNSIYEALVPAGSAVDVYWTRLAKNQIKDHNDRVARGDKSAMKIGGVDFSDPTNVEMIKRALITNDLDKLSGSKISDVDRRLGGLTINVNNSTANAPKLEAFDYIVGDINKAVNDRVVVNKKVDGVTVEEYGVPLNKLTSTTYKNIIIDLANGANGGGNRLNQNNLVIREEGGLIKVYKPVWDIDEKTGKRKGAKELKDITTINPADLDLPANRGQGQKTNNRIAIEQQTKKKPY